MQRPESYNLEVHCPVRVDIAGAWTDCPTFCTNGRRGATINLAIMDVGRSGQPITGVKMQRSNKSAYVYQVHTPPGSGLGSSGALNLCQTLLADPPTNALELAVAYPGRPVPVALAVRAPEVLEYVTRAHRIESAMGVVGGFQDMQAAMYGACRCYHYDQGQPTLRTDAVLIEPFVVAKLFCVRVGGERASTDLHHDVWSRDDTQRNTTLTAMAEHANAVAAQGIRTGTYLADVLAEQTKFMRCLSPNIVLQEFGYIRNALISGGIALEGKPCGAGGTGYALFVGTTVDCVDAARDVLPEGADVFPVIPSHGAYMTYSTTDVDAVDGGE